MKVDGIYMDEDLYSLCVQMIGNGRRMVGSVDQVPQSRPNTFNALNALNALAGDVAEQVSGKTDS